MKRCLLRIFFGKVKYGQANIQHIILFSAFPGSAILIQSAQRQQIETKCFCRLTVQHFETSANQFFGESLSRSCEFLRRLSDTFFHNENVGKTNTGNVYLNGFAFTFQYYLALFNIQVLILKCGVEPFISEPAVMACSLFR